MLGSLVIVLLAISADATSASRDTSYEAALKAKLRTKFSRWHSDAKAASFKPTPDLPAVTQVGIGKWRLVPRHASKFMSYSDSAPAPDQQRALLALKLAWGEHFFGADTWNRLSSSWYGVNVDGSGIVYSLELPGCGITGPFPAEIGALSGLQTLDLQGNSLIGNIQVGVLSKLPQLSALFLSNNQLSGEFPWADIAGLSFSFLELYGNLFSGPVPPSLFSTSLQLQSLSLGGGNRFTGQLPAQVSSSALSQLDLAGNQFSGTIPASLAQLPNLEIIDLSGNQLTGVFPWPLSQLPFLVSLNLRSNQLSGRLPTNFTFGPSLRALVLANNFFTGDMPSFPNLSDGCPESDTVNCYLFTPTIDLSNNFLNGPSKLSAPLPWTSSYPAMVKVCPFTDTPNNILVAGNCLHSYGGCQVQGQRAAKECTGFCGTGSRSGQCSKRGMCVPSFGASGTRYNCMCIRGFKATGRNNSQCAKSH